MFWSLLIATEVVLLFFKAKITFKQTMYYFTTEIPTNDGALHRTTNLEAARSHMHLEQRCLIR